MEKVEGTLKGGGPYEVASRRGVDGRASGVCQYREAKHEDLSEGPCFDRDVVTITQCEATPNGSPCDVDFGAEPEGAVASAAKGFGNGAAAIIPDLPQSVACESHHDGSEGLAGAALELDGVAAREIDVASAAVRVVTHQLGEVPGFGAVEIQGAPERKLVGPIATSQAATGSRSGRRRVEGVAGNEVEPRHLPPDSHGLHVEIVEAKAIDADFGAVGLESKVRRGNARGGIPVERMPGELERDLDADDVGERAQTEVNGNGTTIAVDEIVRSVVQEAIGDVDAPTGLRAGEQANRAQDLVAQLLRVGGKCREERGDADYETRGRSLPSY